MPKIAIVCRDVSGISGTVTTVLEHSRRLAALGWEVLVYGERLDKAAIEATGARPRRVYGWPWGSYLKRRLFAALVRRAVAADGCDLVHGHGDCLEQDVLSLHNCVHAAHEAVYGAPLPAGAGVGRIHKRQLRQRRFRLLIANSKLMQKEVTARFEVPQSLTTVIYPGHDAGRFKASDRAKLGAAVRRGLGCGKEEVLFGLITSGDFAKRGVDAFLAAFGLLSRKARGVKAVVIGKESRLGPYLRRAGESGIGGLVKFLPAAPDVERYYHALDVYVHPAHYEEFGQSVQEALACGLPVLTGAEVGAAELIQGEGRDFLLPSIEPEALAGKMERLALDGVLRERLGRLGPPAVRANTWDGNFQATLTCYKTLLKK